MVVAHEGKLAENYSSTGKPFHAADIDANLEAVGTTDLATGASLIKLCRIQMRSSVVSRAVPTKELLVSNRHPKDIAQAAEAFEAQSIAIIDRFRTLVGVKAPSPFESQWGAFKCEAYKLIRDTKGSAGGHKIIKHLVDLAQVAPPRLHYVGNEFHWGLLAIDPESDVLDRKKVSLFARQMAYAHLHGVHPHFLVGFLCQSGSSAAVTRKLKKGGREPWLRAAPRP